MTHALIKILSALDLSPLPSPATDNDTLQKIFNIVFVTVGAAAVLVITIAGLSYILAQGDTKKTAQAKDAIMYALIGLAVSISALVIVRFVLGGLK